MLNSDKVRKLYNGEYNNKVTVGYSPELDNIHRKEGEEWTDENGDVWFIKNGIRQKKPREKTIIHEKICKNCGRDIRFADTYRLDIKTWTHTGLCFECFFKNETRLKESGKWEEFNELRDLKNERAFLKDFISKCEEAYKECDDENNIVKKYFNSDGSYDSWDCEEVMKTIKHDIEEDLKYAKERYEKINNRIVELMKNQENNS